MCKGTYISLLLFTLIMLMVPWTLLAEELCMVVKVVDGDTIKVVCDGEKVTVRFIGIDTPETHRPKTPVQCYGREAATYLQKRIGSKDVRLEYDRERTDKYGRTLAYVYLGRDFINAEMIKKGYAFAYQRFPFVHRKEFIGYEKVAKEHGRGLWGSCEVTCGGRVCHTDGE